MAPGWAEPMLCEMSTEMVEVLVLKSLGGTLVPLRLRKVWLEPVNPAVQPPRYQSDSGPAGLIYQSVERHRSPTMSVLERPSVIVSKRPSGTGGLTSARITAPS